MEPKWTQAILYARISPKKDESDVTSIQAQFAYETDYCNKHEYKVADQFEDVCLSGEEVERPGLWNAVHAVKRGGVLVIYKLDRLARKVFLQEMVRAQLKKQGGRFETVQGLGKSDSAEDKFICQVLGAFAEYERAVINARTRYAMLRHQLNGRRMSHHAPFGWKEDPDNPKGWLKCPREQKVLVQIKKHRTLGRSLYEICRILTVQGLKARAGGWNTTKLSRIVKRLPWYRYLGASEQDQERSHTGNQQ